MRDVFYSRNEYELEFNDYDYMNNSIILDYWVSYLQLIVEYMYKLRSNLYQV